MSGGEQPEKDFNFLWRTKRFNDDNNQSQVNYYANSIYLSRDLPPLYLPNGELQYGGQYPDIRWTSLTQPFCTKCEEPFRPFSVEVAVSFDSWLLLSKIG